MSYKYKFISNKTKNNLFQNFTIKKAIRLFFYINLLLFSIINSEKSLILVTIAIDFNYNLFSSHNNQIPIANEDDRYENHVPEFLQSVV